MSRLRPVTAAAAALMLGLLPLPAAADIAQLWQLVRIGDAPAAARATLDLRAPGRAVGQAPCNRWFASYALTDGQPAALQFGPIGATRMACADLAAEQAFLAALAGVRTAGMQGATLILTGADGLQLEFQPVSP